MMSAMDVEVGGRSAALVVLLSADIEPPSCWTAVATAGRRAGQRK
jgi:hypothetical protein